MKQASKQYIPFQPLQWPNRQWPNKTITKAPIWCSVDLRDGNQALVTPMQLEEKLLMLKTLVDIGFKEIEVGFPSASETEYEILRTLIEGHHIPDDVTIQVLVQARPELIKKTFEAVKGAKNVIVHFYNSTSTLQRKVVFKEDMPGIIKIAVEGAKLIRQLTEEEIASSGMNIRYEYSPESFTGTEIDFAIEICEAVMETLGATNENPIILNLPSTVEMSTPNTYADQIEYFCTKMKNREAAIISIHPHNDRGTGVAAAELALLGGADRIEGTLFGNGERTGNLDIVTVALNMYTQGVDPELDFSNILAVKKIYEACTKMKVPERQPYAGELAFTAFSGSHQDAIRKGYEYMAESDTPYWEVPYLPINPADLSREYEPVIRINSQSGKGGAAFVLQHAVGYRLPKEMHPEFGNIVKAASDAFGDELKEEQIVDLFNREYVEFDGKYKLASHSFLEQRELDGTTHTRFEGKIDVCGDMKEVAGVGNGPIDSFFQALAGIGVEGYEFVNYHEHAISRGSDAKGICYIELKIPGNGHIFGVGIDSNINVAALLGILCAINRAEK
ncbi:2-isopropylmalate synthase [Phascolarctobacterium faecium DSM 14760]|uniref:2-isopropylmalate synthase n=1 Tax=Phascolarctobacterium faecium TaxID=33025 RepID=UPI000DC50698|nr:2-isopropylmalate synthase [Phascolarctobacterium faecium]RAS56245.1 2-isopropylmalate synthase [Phascolarctobacterium faecium DSM 14760]